MEHDDNQVGETVMKSARQCAWNTHDAACLETVLRGDDDLAARDRAP